ncbi:MAG TPA: prepilin peptidase [Candidatus Paceibacterota bacterium]|jgi:leader peptidase (prepilin peptidase)/N-methyltransferase|nr:prepilin peptidase [Candidatus Paceibacterota bacterium]
MFVWIAVAVGLIVGSFLNALLFRFNTGKSVMRGRSACMHCGHELSALDLVPVFSFIFLRGHCRYCRAKISWQYPLVEATAAALAGLIFLQHQEPLLFAYWFLVWMTLLFIVVYDLRHQIIPWSASLTLLALALVYAFLMGTWWGALLGVPLLLLSLVSGGRWMGWGDGFLEISLGLLLGLTAGLTALFVAFWSGALIGVVLLLVSKNRYTMRSEVPFAPFLILGCAVAYFLHVDIFSYLPLLF